MSDIATLPVNELAGRALPGIGHNLPPLSEQLDDEIASAKARADELLEAAESARIASDDDAAKITTLVALIRSHEKTLDDARDARKRPFLESGRLIDAAYAAVIRPLTLARVGADGRTGGLLGMLTEYQRKREAEARAERERIEAEQRRQEEDAARAREAVEAAKARGNGSVAAELEAIRAQEQADALARRAETIRPEPIRSAIGAAGMKREIAFDITDARKLLGWMLKQPLKGNLEQAVRAIMGAYLRQLGVDAVARGVAIPGLEARLETRAQVR